MQDDGASNSACCDECCCEHFYRFCWLLLKAYSFLESMVFVCHILRSLFQTGSNRQCQYYNQINRHKHTNCRLNIKMSTQAILQTITAQNQRPSKTPDASSTGCFFKNLNRSK